MLFILNNTLGSPLVAYWSEFCAFTAEAQVQSLTRGLRSGKLHDVTKNK